MNKGQIISLTEDCRLAKNRLVSAAGPISSIQLSVSPFDHDLYLATVAAGNLTSYSHPTFGYNPESVQLAALMGVVADRASFTHPKRSVLARADHLSQGYLNPLIYFPLDNKRSVKRFLKPFSIKRKIHWTLGVRYDGRPIYVPEDLVYRGDSRDFLYYANDSGLAAHPDPLVAIELATMSRIRADACMRTWYKRLSPYLLDEASLSQHITSRIEYWRTRGRTLTLFQLDNDYGEVYLATLRGQTYPYFACGVGATVRAETEIALFDAIGAAEANFGVLAGEAEPTYSPIPDDLLVPLDHARYYATADGAKNLAFLFERETTSPPFIRKVADPAELAKQLCLTIVWLTAPEADYSVVRVFSPYLVPISYGFGLEHSTHGMLTKNSAKVDEENRYAPHCFYRP